MRNSWLKKMSALVMAAVLLAGAAPAPAEAASRPEIESISYEGYGEVDVDFYGRVQYGNVKVKVTDNKGKTYKTEILERDSDDLTFRVKNPKEGRKYKFTISKIRRKGAKSYTSVSGSFYIAAAAEVKVEYVEYDYSDREVSFELQRRVHWESPRVTIQDSKGRNMVRWIEDRDDDEIEVKVKALTPGAKYTYTISGVARIGTNSYKTIKGSFRA